MTLAWQAASRRYRPPRAASGRRGWASATPRAWSRARWPPSLIVAIPQRRVSAKELPQSLPASAWQVVSWREGSNAPLSSCFPALRARPAHRDYWRSEPRPEEWFLVEWPQGEHQPTKYWRSTLPKDTAPADLVDQAKLRWRIKRDYRSSRRRSALVTTNAEGVRGFHHHATLAIAAYVLRYGTISASARCRGAREPSEQHGRAARRSLVSACRKSQTSNLLARAAGRRGTSRR